MLLFICFLFGVLFVICFVLYLRYYIEAKNYIRITSKQFDSLYFINPDGWRLNCTIDTCWETIQYVSGGAYYVIMGKTFKDYFSMRRRIKLRTKMKDREQLNKYQMDMIKTLRADLEKQKAKSLIV